MKFGRAFFILIVCLLMVGTNVSGQVTRDADHVRIDFSVLSWQRTIRDVYYQNASGEAVKFFVPNGAPSDTFKYFGPKPLVFYKHIGEDAEGNPIKEAIATYDPAMTGDVLLIFVPEPKEGKEFYRLLPLKYSVDDIESGSYRFFNLASYPVYIRFGDSKLKVDPRGFSTIRSNPAESDGLDVAMAVQVSEEPNSAKVVYSAGWTLRAGRSALVFITNERGVPGQIDVKRVYF